jgi:phosphatidylinositol-3-phosphatase
MAMRWIARALLAAVALAGVTAGASAPAAGHAGTACRGAPPASGAYRHVIWIWMENHAYGAALRSSDAPFTNQLAAECGLATNYHNITHPSLPNYIAATSGGTQGITDDCKPRDCSRATQSVFGQVAQAGMTWTAYEESMRRPCDLEGGEGSSPAGEYAPKHDPAAYYLPLRQSCSRRILPLGTPAAGALARALTHRSLPRFAFITPNLCNDTHDCPVSTGDAWLSHWVRKIVSSPTYRRERTVIFVTWDEGEGGGSDDCATNTSDAGCHVATLVVSPSVRRGTRSDVLFNHYSLLRTTEQLLGIPTYLGRAGDASTRSMRKPFHL